MYENDTALIESCCQNDLVFDRSVLLATPVSYGTVDHLRCSLSSENQQTECSSLQSPQYS